MQQNQKTVIYIDPSRNSWSHVWSPDMKTLKRLARIVSADYLNNVLFQASYGPGQSVVKWHFKHRGLSHFDFEDVARGMLKALIEKSKTIEIHEVNTKDLIRKMRWVYETDKELEIERKMLDR